MRRAVAALLAARVVVAARPFCRNGIRAGDAYCCAKSCKVCGGDGCGSRKGGVRMCCTDGPRHRRRPCQHSREVGCVIPPNATAAARPAPPPPPAPPCPFARGGSAEDCRSWLCRPASGGACRRAPDWLDTKIVGVGWKKSGTTSLQAAFQGSTSSPTLRRASEEVAVLDKLGGGWWLVDKSRGAGRGPYGLVPGTHCCWKLHDDDGGAPPPPPPPAPPPAPASPPPPPRDPHADGRRAPPAPPAPAASTPAPGPAAGDYDDADLEAAFAYLDLLIHGDPFSTGPAPPRFNELCASSSEFAARVKAHADDSRRRASDDEDPLGDLG
ncbi:hypothetical protein SO694_00050246 [Aureococcus anophagefferens]|uniref:SH3 domain-containing protein n=1 Tax=Aureococcus anophagefferens TaxID=44056 RepID=A0ABR1FZ24_AURAN